MTVDDMKLRIMTAAILALAVFGIVTSHPTQTIASQRTEYGYGDGTTIALANKLTDRRSCGCVPAHCVWRGAEAKLFCSD